MNNAADIGIHFQDNAIIVIEKPSLLLSVPGRGANKQDSVSSRLQRHFGEIHVVHRLDWETSGIMIFARHKTALKHLQQQFMRRSVDKTYHALVAGELRGSGMIDLPLIADWPRLPRQTVDHHRGKPCTSYWKAMNHVLVKGTICTLLALTPLTGRSHQLRVHLAAISHPILGDRLYAPEVVSQMALRLQLHATHLCFNHPVNGETMTFQSPAGFVNENC